MGFYFPAKLKEKKKGIGAQNRFQPMPISLLSTETLSKLVRGLRLGFSKTRRGASFEWSAALAVKITGFFVSIKCSRQPEYNRRFLLGSDNINSRWAERLFKITGGINRFFRGAFVSPVTFYNAGQMWNCPSGWTEAEQKESLITGLESRCETLMCSW